MDGFLESQILSTISTTAFLQTASFVDSADSKAINTMSKRKFVRGYPECFSVYEGEYSIQLCSAYPCLTKDTEKRVRRADGDFDRVKYVNDFIRFINGCLEISTLPMPSHLADVLIIFAETILRGHHVDNNECAGEGRFIDEDNDESPMPPLLTDIQILEQSVQDGILVKKIQLRLPEDTPEDICTQVCEEWEQIREGRTASAIICQEGNIASVRCSACLEFLRSYNNLYALRHCGCVSTSPLLT